MTVHPYLGAPPLAFAHRGGAGERPENTLPAFERAIELGYRYLETDAHLSRDGVVFAFHDDALDRTTDRAGRISEMTADEVSAADAGWSFTTDGGRTFPFRGLGIRVPRLVELLEAWPHACLNIDAKTDAVAAPLASLLARMRVTDRVCVGAFSDARLARLRRLVPGLCTSMGPRAVTVARLWSAARRPIPAMGAQCLQIPVTHRVAGRHIALADRSLVAAAHRSGLQVHIWTIDEAVEMDRLLDIGVDGIMTDRPLVLREVLERRGVWSAG